MTTPTTTDGLSPGPPAHDTVVNLTGHDVWLTDGQLSRVLPAHLRPARVASKTRHRDLLDVDGLRIPVVERFDHEVFGLPEPSPGVYYVTSSLVAAYASRVDILALGGLVRDERSGRVISARYLMQSGEAA
jgi:hypothetical protein